MHPLPEPLSTPHTGRWRGALFAGVLAGLLAVPAQASPTSNEYEACHRRAAATLQSCLDTAPGRPPDRCWADARRANDLCYAQVRESHRRQREGWRRPAR